RQLRQAARTRPPAPSLTGRAVSGLLRTPTNRPRSRSPSMLRRLSLLVLAALAVPAVYAAPPAEKISPDDEKLLKGAKLAVEGPALLDYFRKRTVAPQDRDKINQLIRKLGDDSFQVREKASDDLRAFGAVALPQLRRALNDLDEEIRERAREGI